MPQIGVPYLLAISIPFHEDAGGDIWFDPLWHQDLMAHLDYVEDLILLAPRRRCTTATTGMIRWQTPPGRRVRFIAMPDPRRRATALLSLPCAAVVAWRAIGLAQIVHSGVAGWPLPIGMVVNPLAKWRGKPLVLVVESAFWRIQPGQKARLPARILARISEGFARWSLRQASLGIYTSQAYRDSLPVRPGRLAAVIPASWIQAGDVIPEEAARALWHDRPGPVSFLLPSRLEPEKGLGLALEALRRLEATARPITVDVIGTGRLAAEVDALASTCRHVALRLLDPVPYGAPFLHLLRSYHGVIVPTTGDEQPRILYDAFSQSVPVIATATAGNRQVVSHGKTGLLVPENDPFALGEALIDASIRPDDLRRMGLAAVHEAQNQTHLAMHARRAHLLQTLIESQVRCPCP